MAKGEAKKNNALNDAARDKFNASNEQFYNDSSGYFNDARNRTNDAYNTAKKGYMDVYSDPTTKGGYQDIIGSGGYNPADAGAIRGYASQYADFANRGLDDATKARMRGNGVFDEMAKTGGYSNQDIANVRARTASQVPSFYAALKNNLDNANTVQGGWNPGYSAQASKMARDSAHGSSEAALSGELGLADAIRSGRMGGANAVSGAENQIQGAEGQRFLAGMGGATGTLSDLNNNMTRNRLGALSGYDSSRMGALSGLGDLYRGAVGETGMYNDSRMKSLFGGYDQEQNSIQQRMNYNPNKGFMDYFTPLAGAALGGLSGLSQFGMFGGKPNPGAGGAARV